MKNLILLLVVATMSVVAQAQFNDSKCYKCESAAFRLTHDKYCQKCDSLIPNPPGPPVQAFDADTLFFHNETEIRDWCAAYDMGWWEVHPPQFDYYQTISEAVPYKWGDGCKLRASIGGTDSSFYMPDQVYWFKPDGCIGEGWGVGQCIPNNNHWINEEFYYGLQYSSIRDHLHLAKGEREMRPCFCDEGDLFGVVEYVTNPFTGQVVAFYDIYRWSNRWGYNLWNENLSLYMVWPELAGYNTVEFELNTVHLATGCDYTFRTYFPGHETMTLYFRGERLVDGVPVTMTIAEAYGAELGR